MNYTKHIIIIPLIPPYSMSETELLSRLQTPHQEAYYNRIRSTRQQVAFVCMFSLFDSVLILMQKFSFHR